jgi:hypothetical protein
MICINTYSLVKRVCSEHSSYILSALPLILNYRRTIRLEGIDYASNEGLDLGAILLFHMMGPLL